MNRPSPVHTSTPTAFSIHVPIGSSPLRLIDIHTNYFLWERVTIEGGLIDSGVDPKRETSVGSISIGFLFLHSGRYMGKLKRSKTKKVPLFV